MVGGGKEDKAPPGTLATTTSPTPEPHDHHGEQGSERAAVEGEAEGLKRKATRSEEP